MTMSAPIRLLAATIASGTFASAADAAPVTTDFRQDGTYNMAGSVIRNDGSSGTNANKNYGVDPTIVVGRTSTNGGRLRGVFGIDVSAIPTGSTVQAASFKLVSSSGDGGGSQNAVQTLSLFSIGSFTEGTGLGGSNANDVTWNNRTTGTAWPTAGALDGSSTPLGTANVNPVNPSAPGSTNTPTFSSANLTALIQAAVNSATNKTVYLLLKAPDAIESTNTRNVWLFHSDDASASVAANRPTLSVTYVPEPSGLAAVAVLGAAALPRRRRA